MKPTSLLVAAMALASVYFTKLGLFAAVGTLLAWAALPRAGGDELRRDRWLLLGAALLSGVGFLRFLTLEAMPGIVQGGNLFTEQRAISRLREVLFAEDSARRSAARDPDHDGIGSAALLGELTGELAPRGGERLQAPLLEGFPKLSETTLGPASAIGGYYLIVCLPRAGGGFTAQPGVAIDEELAERRFVAYAWPTGGAPGLEHAIALDEHEHIWLAPSVPGLRRGPDAPPACDDIVRETSAADWKPWRNKQPRKALPGDRTAGR